MRVYISMDAEGVSGIFNLGQVMSSNVEYAFARRMMASDINAAAEGAYQAGAELVVVNDAHNNGNNLLIEQLDPRIDLISGSLRPLGMAEGAQLGFDAALLIGYHRRKGAKGVASHSYSYGSMVELVINGKLASEHDLVGYCLGAYNIPVVFLSGDDLVCADARESIPGVYTVETKTAISNNAALCHHPRRTAQAITEAVRQALLNWQKDGIRPMRLEGEVHIDVRYSAEVQAARAATAQNTLRLDENRVRYFGPDYLTAYNAFMIGTSLAAAFRDDADLYR